MSNELKPCPFCGGKAKVYRHESNWDFDEYTPLEFEVECSNEDCEIMPSATSGGRFSKRDGCEIEATKKWNQRAETETEKRLTAIATKHATRADELYEALDGLINSVSRKGISLDNHIGADCRKSLQLAVNALRNPDEI